MKKCLVMLAAILLCLIIGGAPFAVAQDEEEGDEFTLEEITVTAQKREENQQKVAIAMEVITGEDLTAMGKNDIDEILKNIANVEISAASTGTRINIRGLVDDGGTMSDLELQAPMVNVNVDGAYSNMHNVGTGLFDIERVEVLMGPQSTMYGANSPGGIVNIVTAAPKTDKFSANASVEYGSYDLLNLQGALNVPVLQDTLALRVSASKNKSGSWVPNDATSDSTAVRVKALWDVYKDLDVTVTGNWSKRGGGGMMAGSVVPFINQDDVDDPWTLADDSDDGTFGNRNDQTTKGFSADINWSIPYVGNLSLVPSYSKSDASGWRTRTSTSGDVTTTTSYYHTQDNEQKGGEARITNPDSFEWFQWIVGATYSKSEQNSLDDYEGTTSDSGRSVTQNKSALFGNITYPLPFYDRLRLNLGYRRSWDESNGVEIRSGNPNPQGNPDRQSKPNWKYGFEYDVADNMMLYGSYSSSYRSLSGFAQRIGGDYPPNEELKSYTMGLKSRWLDNRLQVNLNAYYYDYANKYASGFKEAYVTEDQLYPVDSITPIEPEEDTGGSAPPPPPGQAPPPPGGGEPDTYVEEPDGYYPSMDIYDANGNGITDEPFEWRVTDPNPSGFGAFTSLGLDLSTTWIITSKDRLNFSIAYLDSEWKDLHFRYFYAPQNTETDFADTYPDFRYNVFEWEDLKGETPANSPKWGVTANYQHNFTLGALGTLTPRIDMKYKSEYHTAGSWDEHFDGYIYTKQEAYMMWDGSAAFQHSGGKWSLNAYVKNITNYAVKTQVRVTGMGTEMRIGDPRTYGATFSYKFF